MTYHDKVINTNKRALLIPAPLSDYQSIAQVLNNILNLSTNQSKLIIDFLKNRMCLVLLKVKQVLIISVCPHSNSCNVKPLICFTCVAIKTDQDQFDGSFDLFKMYLKLPVYNQKIRCSCHCIFPQNILLDLVL
jgi:hypothetical protein